jgi:hypothetical protein
MKKNLDLGEILIEAMTEAVAHDQGKVTLRETRLELPDECYGESK